MPRALKPSVFISILATSCSHDVRGCLYFFTTIEKLIRSNLMGFNTFLYRTYINSLPMIASCLAKSLKISAPN